MSKKSKKGSDFPMVEALRAIPEHYQIDNIRIKKLFAVLYHYSRINKHMAFTLGQDVIARELGIDRTTIYRNIQNLVGYYEYVIYQPGRKGCNSIWYIVKPDEDKISIELRDKMPEPLLNRYDTLCSGSQLYVAKTSQLAEMQCVIEKMQHNIEDSTEDYVAKTSQELNNEEVTEKMQHNIEGTINDYVTKSPQSVESEEVTEKMPHNVSGTNATLIYNNIINKKENINNKKEIVKQQYSTLPLKVSDQIGNVVVDSENNNFEDMKQTIDSLELQVKELQSENEQLKNENQHLNKRLADAIKTYRENMAEINNLKATIDQQQSKQQAPLAVVVSSSYNLLIKQFYNSLNVDTERAKGFLEQLNKLTDLGTRQQENVARANDAYKKKIEDKQKTTTQSNSIIPDDLLDEAAELLGKCKRWSNTDEILQYSPDEVEQTMDRLVQVQKELRQKHKYLKGRKDWQAAIYNRELEVFITWRNNDLSLPKHDCVYFNNLKTRVTQMRLSQPLKSVAFVQHPGLD